MTTPFRVCLFGFAPADDQALREMLTTDPRRTPHYVGAASLEHSDVVVANADNADALAELVRLELLDQTVYIGSDIEGEGWLKHPIDAKRLLHELDRLALRQAPWYTPRTEPADLPEDGPPVAVVVSESPSVAIEGEPAAPALTGPGQPAGSSAAPKPPRAKPPATERLAHTRALLVDDSEVALRYLESRLHRLGMHTDRALGSGKAIELLSRAEPVDFVLLDIELGAGSDLDGLALCQHIKRHRRAHGAVPTVILVSAHHSELDRARGTLAGCDAYLAKPVDEALLVQALLQHAPR